ncbi:MAG: M6 family metalloprotease domain-containing protein [Thermodesulfovibrionales bacterium]
MHSLVFGAPHITKTKKEPVERPGIPIKERLAKKMPMALFAPIQYPATVNVLFLRVQFQNESPDDPQTTGNGTWQWCGSQTGCPNNDPDYWLNNAKDKFINYWSEASYGKLQVNITISQKIYILPHSMSYYGDESYSALENLIYDSITQADSDIDFSQYDAIFIIHAGAGEETDLNGDTPKDIWSLYYQDACISPNDTGTNCLTVDGRQIKEAIIMPQTGSQDNIVVDPFGVYVHEFAHWLGLPDLYCTNLICLLDGVGRWSLMGDGIYNSDPLTCSNGSCIYGSSPSHPDAWSKVYLGWVTPEEISSDGVQKILSPIETYPEIIKLQASTSTVNQYLLLENRQLTGFDKGLPGHGLLVWLIDEDVINQNINSNTINNSLYRPGVKLIEADGDWNLLKYGCSGNDDCGSPSDPFPGITGKNHLTPVGNPSSNPYTPYGWVNLRNINESGGNITLLIGFGPLPPQGLTINSKTLSWSPVDGASYYKIYRNGSYLDQTTSLSFTDNSAQNGYIYQVSAVDSSGDESGLSNSVIANITSNSGSSGGGGNSGSSGGGGNSGSSGGGCFIATAAYGSYLNPHVQILRVWRDKYLMTNAIGRRFVEFYYRISPPIANIISRHESLKIATRIMLTPLVYSIQYPQIAIIIIVAFTGLIFFRRTKE